MFGLDADGNVTVTRTDVARALKVEAKPPQTGPQCGPRSVTLLAKAPSRQRRKVKDWEPGFRNQYETFKSAASNEYRKLIWKI